MTLQPHSGFGRLGVASNKAFNGVKIFSATMMGDRDGLGEKINSWLRNHSKIEPVDSIVTQSSDSAFHCVAITIFYWEDLGD